MTPGSSLCQEGGFGARHRRNPGALTTRLGTEAVDIIEMNAHGYMAGLRGNSLDEVSLEEVAQGPRTISPDDPLIKSARSISICFGD